MIHNLVISGGSIRSISVIGCLKYIFEKLPIQVRNVVGTSAGAIIGLMVVLGYTPSEMETMMKYMVKHDYHKLLLDDLLDLKVLDTFGFDSGAGLESFIAEVLERKGLSRDATFVEMAKKTGKNFVVCVANVTQGKSQYLCVDTDPDMRVALAVRMSAALPILFSPIRYKNDMYTDGALYESLPTGYIATCFKDSLKDTLALRTRRRANSAEITNIYEYYNALLSSLVTAANVASKQQTTKVTILDVPDYTAPGNMFGFDFENFRFAVDDTSIDTAVRFGYDCMRKFMEPDPIK
jgi:predicted acylesterase/phospholipase RssA